MIYANNSAFFVFLLHIARLVTTALAPIGGPNMAKNVFARFACAKVLLFSHMCKKMDDNLSNISILQENQKKIADKCRQLDDVIRRRGTGANKTGIAVQRNTGIPIESPLMVR